MTIRIIASILLSLCAATAAAAQTVHPAIPDARQVLAPPHGMTPAAPVTLPALQQPAAAAAAHLHFHRVRIIGAHVLPDAAIAAAFAALKDRDIATADLKPALDAVDGLYRAAGYPLGRAYVPAQRLVRGVLAVHVVEGHVGRIIVSADSPRLKARALRIAARLLHETPLTTATLQRAMLLIQDLPGVTVASRFQDMDMRTGATTLAIAITHRAVTAAFTMDNRANLYSLPFAPYLTATLNDLPGIDRVSLTALLSPRQKDYAFYDLSLLRHIGDDGLSMTLDGSWAQLLDGRSLAPYAIRSRTAQLSYGLSYPLLLAADETLATGAKLYFTRTAYNILGTTFARDAALALQMGGDYARSIGGDAGLAASLYVTRGLAGFGGGPHTRPAAAADFTRLRGALRLAWQPARNLTLILRSMGQYASAPLYASEEIAFGGLDYGRGFDAAEISGDGGAGVSFQPEYRIPFDLGGSGLAKGWSVTPYIFGDYAKVWNRQGDHLPDGELVSAGGGARLGISDLMTVTLEAARPLNRTPLYRHDRAARLYAGVELGLGRALSLIGESR